MLPFSAPEATPQPQLREQVIAAIAHTAESTPAPRPAPQAVASAPARRSGQRRSFWAALAFAALALVLLIWNISIRRELDTQTAIVTQSRQNWQTMIVLLDDTALAKYAVAADPPPPAGEYPAHGHFWASPKAQVACLVVQGLPDLPADQVYQVWLVRDSWEASGGTFEVHSGKAWTFVDTGEPIVGYSAMFVTVEPAGGSATPDGPRVMSGTLAGATMAGLADRQQLLGLLNDGARRED
jgi:anti-sigma-K factor RskA